MGWVPTLQQIGAAVHLEQQRLGGSAAHLLVRRRGAQRCIDCQALDLVALGQHGLDVAAAVLGEDERLGAAAAALRALLLLRKHEDGGVHDDALGLEHKLLRTQAGQGWCVALLWKGRWCTARVERVDKEDGKVAARLLC